MRDLIRLNLKPDAEVLIRMLYTRMGWEQFDQGEYCTFEDACALYIRLGFHQDVLPADQTFMLRAKLNSTLQHHMEDEVSE